MATIQLTINQQTIEAEDNQSILKIARDNGVAIPTLCYDERMEVYGSCGLCMVEIQGAPKLFKACATMATDGMVIETNTPRVIESRKTNLELLLSNHIGDCVAPCVLACPGKTDCQGYVGLIANGEHQEALKLIKEQLPLPASIGRVCPHPCETACRRGEVEEPISILWLKRFAADLDRAKGMFMPKIAQDKGKTVGVVGGGPGGLTAAYFLRTMGYGVTVYDAMPKMGGMLRYGIPEYRLPKNVVDDEVQLIEQMGARFVNNVEIGKGETTLQALRNQHDALYLAIGAWRGGTMNIGGSDGVEVLDGIDFLRRVSNNEPFAIGKRVAIVGGGNTAMDVCRTVVRLGVDTVYNLYRRTRAEMPAESIEIDEAIEEGVILKNLVNPIEVYLNAEGGIDRLVLQKMKLGAPDASGRRRPVNIEGETETLEVDTLILAIGQYPELQGFDDLETTKWGTIVADVQTYRTNLEGVFAGGDCINDGATIAIQAIGDAKRAVEFIDQYLQGEAITYRAPYYVTREGLDPEEIEKYKKNKRPTMAQMEAEARKNNFMEIVHGYTEEQAVAEGSRCLECGCHDYFECQLVNYANDYQVAPERFAGSLNKLRIEDDNPFILRDPNKCILCGKCVRVCDEVVGITALGLVERGFDTYVAPSLDRTLQESPCIFCGSCIDVCPTGALGAAPVGNKNVPADYTIAKTICGFCSSGCYLAVETDGNTIFHTVADEKQNHRNGVICGRGRFGTQWLQGEERLKTPLIKEESHWREVSLYDSVIEIVKKSQTIQAKYGQNAFKIALSPRLTLDEALAYRFIASQRGIEVVSFSASPKVEGIDYGKVSLDYEVLKQSQKILTYGLNSKDQPVLSNLLLHKQKAGQVIEDDRSAISKADAQTSILWGPHLKLEERKTLWEEIKRLGLEGRLMIVERYNNSKGLEALGISAPTDLEEVKGLFVIGEDIAWQGPKPEFLAVADTWMTELAEKADLVLPMQAYPEVAGHSVNAEGKLVRFKAIQKSPMAFTHTDFISELSQAFNVEWGALEKEVQEGLSALKHKDQPMSFQDTSGLSEEKNTHALMAKIENALKAYW